MMTHEVVVISTVLKTYLINQLKLSSCLSIQICTLAMAESEQSRPEQGEEEKEKGEERGSEEEREEEEPFSPLPESAEQVFCCFSLNGQWTSLDLDCRWQICWRRWRTTQQQSRTV